MTKTVQVLVAGVVLVVIVGAVTLAEVRGSAQSVLIFSTAVLAALPGILSLNKSSEAAEASKAAAEDAAVVKTQTNGALPAAVHEAIVAAVAGKPLPPEIARHAAESDRH